MRRSSWAALILGCASLAVAVAVYSSPFDRAARRMTRREAARFVAEAQRAFEQRDAGALLAFVAPDAELFGRPASQVAPIIRDALREAGGDFQLRVTGLSAQDRGQEAVLEMDVEVGQETDRATISYYRTHLTATLKRDREDGLLGLLAAERWQIARLSTSQSLDLPPPD